MNLCTYEYKYKIFIWIHYVYEFIYMKWPYKFKLETYHGYGWKWIHIWNDHMNLYWNMCIYRNELATVLFINDINSLQKG